MAEKKKYLHELLDEAISEPVAEKVNFQALRTLLEATVAKRSGFNSDDSAESRPSIKFKERKPMNTIVKSSKTSGLSHSSDSGTAIQRGKSNVSSISSAKSSKLPKIGSSSSSSKPTLRAKSSGKGSNDEIKFVVNLSKGLICGDNKSTEFTFGESSLQKAKGSNSSKDQSSIGKKSKAGRLNQNDEDNRLSIHSRKCSNEDLTSGKKLGGKSIERQKSNVSTKSVKSKQSSSSGSKLTNKPGHGTAKSHTAPAKPKAKSPMEKKLEECKEKEGSSDKVLLTVETPEEGVCSSTDEARIIVSDHNGGLNTNHEQRMDSGDESEAKNEDRNRGKSSDGGNHSPSRQEGSDDELKLVVNLSKELVCSENAPDEFKFSLEESKQHLASASIHGRGRSPRDEPNGNVSRDHESGSRYGTTDDKKSDHKRVSKPRTGSTGSSKSGSSRTASVGRKSQPEDRTHKDKTSATHPTGRKEERREKSKERAKSDASSKSGHSSSSGIESSTKTEQSASKSHAASTGKSFDGRKHSEKPKKSTGGDDKFKVIC